LADFRKLLKNQISLNLSSGRWGLPSGGTDRQTDRQTWRS